MASAATISVELNLDTKNFNTRITAAASAMTQLGNAARAAEPRVSGLGQSMHQWVQTLGSLQDALGVVGVATVGWVGGIVKANADLERTNSLLVAMATASTQLGREQDALGKINALGQMAKTVPFDAKTLTDAMVSLSGAGLDPMSGSLRTLADAVAAFGGTSGQLGGAATAIGAMADKGVVSMDLLRGRLSDGVPNAADLMARGMGLSMAEFTRAVSSGSVEASVALEKMFNEMRRSYGGSAAEAMGNFSGQMSLLKTNLNDLMTQNTGMSGFFDQVILSLGDVNALLASPTGKAWATDLGDGLRDILRGGSDTLLWVVDFRHELAELATIMASVFVGRTVLVGLFDMIAAMRTATLTARGLGVAVGGMLGPISLVVSVLYELANATGVFSGSTENAIKDIENGIITDRAVKLVSERRAQISDEVARLTAEIEPFQKRLDQANAVDPTSGPAQAFQRQFDIRMGVLNERKKELEKYDGLLKKGNDELTERNATTASTGALRVTANLYDDQRAQLEVKQLDFAKRREGLTAGSDAMKKLDAEVLSEIKKFYADYLGELDKRIQVAREQADSEDAGKMAAGKKTLLALTQQRKQTVMTMEADLRTVGKPVDTSKPIDTGKPGNGGNTPRLAPRITAAIPTAENPEAKKAADAAQALKQIEDKKNEFAAQAEEVRLALVSGMAAVDPKGFKAKIAEIDAPLSKLAKGTPEYDRAEADTKRTRADAASVQSGQLGLDLRSKTKGIDLGLMEDQRAAREATLQNDIDVLDRELALYAEHGGNVKAIEADVQDYKRALQDKAARDSEFAFQKTLRDWRDVTTQLGNAASGWLTSASDELTTFVMTGKANFTNLAQSIIKDLIRISIQTAIGNAAGGSGIFGFLSKGVSLLGGALGFGGGTAPINDASIGTLPNVDVAHTGGIIGRDGLEMRSVLSSVFVGAKRFHTGGMPGLSSGEVPAILRRGEGVFTEGQMAALGAGLGGGAPGVTVANTFNIQAGAGSGDTAKDQALAQQIGAQVTNQVRGLVVDELYRQGQPGGLLYGR